MLLWLRLLQLRKLYKDGSDVGERLPVPVSVYNQSGGHNLVNVLEVDRLFGSRATPILACSRHLPKAQIKASYWWTWGRGRGDLREEP